MRIGSRAALVGFVLLGLLLGARPWGVTPAQAQAKRGEPPAPIRDQIIYGPKSSPWRAKREECVRTYVLLQ